MTTKEQADGLERPYGTGSIGIQRGRFKARIRVVDEDSGKRVPMSRVFESALEAHKWLDDMVAREKLAKERLKAKQHGKKRDADDRAQDSTVPETGELLVPRWPTVYVPQLPGSEDLLPALREDSMVFPEVMSHIMRNVQNEAGQKYRRDKALALRRLAPYFSWVPRNPVSENDVIVALAIIQKHLLMGWGSLGNINAYGNRIPSLSWEELSRKTEVQMPVLGKVSSSRQRFISLTAHEIVDALVEFGLIPKVKAYRSTLRIPKVNRPAVENVSLPARQSRVVLDYLLAHPCSRESHLAALCSFRWLLAFESGRRQGEILGLLTSDFIDEGNGDIYYIVRRHLVVENYHHGCKLDTSGNHSCGFKHAYRCSKVSGGPRLKDGTKGGESITPKLYLRSDAIKAAYSAHLAARTEEMAEVEKRESTARAHGIPLPTDIHRHLLGPLADDLMFINPKTGKYRGHKTDFRHWHSIQLAAYEWSREVGHPKAIPEGSKPLGVHAIRHRAASDMNKSGVAPSLLQETLGHQSFATTLRYITHSDDERKGIEDTISSDSWHPEVES